jgi:hypothetical protein
MKFLKLSAACLALLLLAGCAQLPRSSDIKVGPEVQGEIASDYLYYSPVGPSSGESQQDILNGFINAGTGPQNDYEAARQYLAQSFKTKWNPNDEVLIQQGNPAVSFNTKQEATVSVQVQAKVDLDGHYQVMDAGTNRMLDFKMVREGGEWRISSAPNLTILIRPVFDVIFRSYSIYFFDSQKKHLVPDLRWFPSRASTATRMMNAMLKGPTDWLKDAVTSAIPAGTTLSLNSVTVAQGIAAVDLSAKALTARASDRRLMKAQIRATLTQLPTIYSVVISVERGPQEIADLPDLVPAEASTELVVMQGGELSILNQNATTPIGGTADLIARTGATDFAITAAQDWLALKAGDGVYRSHLGLFGSNPTLVDARPAQLVPEFDNFGYLWTMTRKAGETAQVTSQGGIKHMLGLGWLDSYPRRQFAVSAEGSRIALLVGSGTSVRVFVASVLRDKNGMPESIGAPLEVVRAGGFPISVSWSDENSLAVLSKQSDSSVAASFFSIGGVTRDVGVIDGGRALEARSGSSMIYAVNFEHNLFEYRNLGWSRMRSGVQAMHFAN